MVVIQIKKTIKINLEVTKKEWMEKYKEGYEDGSIWDICIDDLDEIAERILEDDGTCTEYALINGRLWEMP